MWSLLFVVVIIRQQRKTASLSSLVGIEEASPKFRGADIFIDGVIARSETTKQSPNQATWVLFRCARNGMFTGNVPPPRMTEGLIGEMFRIRCLLLLPVASIGQDHCVDASGPGLHQGLCRGAYGGAGGHPLKGPLSRERYSYARKPGVSLLRVCQVRYSFRYCSSSPLPSFRCLVSVDIFRTAPVIHQVLGLAHGGAAPLPHLADHKIFGSMPCPSVLGQISWFLANPLWLTAWAVKSPADRILWSKRRPNQI